MKESLSWHPPLQGVLLQTKQSFTLRQLFPAEHRQNFTAGEKLSAFSPQGCAREAQRAKVKSLGQSLVGIRDSHETNA